MIKLILPVPPSVNDYYGTNRNTGRKYIKQAGKTYKQEVFVEAYNTIEDDPFACPVIVTADLIPKRNNRDIDNIFKCLLDSLKGTVYIDDKQVKQLITAIHPADKENPRVIVTVDRIQSDHQNLFAYEYRKMLYSSDFYHEVSTTDSYPF